MYIYPWEERIAWHGNNVKVRTVLHASSRVLIVDRIASLLWCGDHSTLVACFMLGILFQLQAHAILLSSVSGTH